MARPTLGTHPKFFRLASLVGGRAMARGVLELIWDAAYASGEPGLGDADAVEAVADWRGERGALAAALVASGFLDLDGAAYAVHDLEHHAPDYVLKRWQREADRRARGETVRSARRAAATARWEAVRHANGGQCPVTDRITANTDRLSADRVPPPAPAPAPAPARSDPDQTIFPETAGPSAGTVAGITVLNAGLVFPTDGKIRAWPVPAAAVAAWEGDFPSLDIDAAIRHALAWVKANPSRQKTAKGMPAFLVGWFGRAQERGEHRRRRPNGTHAESALSETTRSFQAMHRGEEERRRMLSRGRREGDD